MTNHPTKSSRRRQSKTLSDLVYEGLREEIITCQLEPGELFFEGDVAEKYQVSKAPVREAVKRLTQEGLIQSIPGVGNTVTPVTLKDVRELFEFRRILETAAVQRAVEKATDAQLAELENLIGQPDTLATVESRIRWHRANVAFHVKIAAIAGNEQLERAVRNVMEQMFRLEHLNLGIRSDTASMMQEHQAIVEALRMGDEKLAVERAMHSIDGSIQLIQQSLERGRKG